LTNVVWVGAGLYHTLARRADGTVAAWGYNGSGQTDVPAGATNVAAAACGGLHNLALHHDQSLSGWGYNFYGQTSTPTNPAPPCSIAGGGNHSLAVIRNTSPVASPVEVTGYVNHDLVVQLIGPDPDGDAVSFFITSTPSPGALYQYAAGARGDLIPDWLTEVTDPGGRVIFAPATDGIGTPYATGWYYASDGNYYPPLASIILNIVLPAAPELTASASGWTAAGGFELVFTGTSNATYQVWASTNLIHWEPLGAAAPLAPGSFHFLDSSATNWPQRFYRAGAGTNP
jgi:hypothetical protein